MIALYLESRVQMISSYNSRSNDQTKLLQFHVKMKIANVDIRKLQNLLIIHSYNDTSLRGIYIQLYCLTVLTTSY